MKNSENLKPLNEDVSMGVNGIWKLAIKYIFFCFPTMALSYRSHVRCIEVEGMLILRYNWECPFKLKM